MYEMTVAGMIQQARDLNAGVVRLVGRNDRDELIWMVAVAVDEDARDLLGVIEAWEASQDEAVVAARGAGTRGEELDHA